ncbi:hypothetical protein M422DRAFT_249355 [Sphaerobolus stellatus SS14]|uniref:Uncharacterized protein n=1 Tax=Sphaerobolus stellatus (strain SS14) TaxID=990650 RepID=A0A0C9UVH8_SPHS4|nr:hypothetical protein M422DRAFT_249355 [Sphaerobolus stellatus SS14]
MASYREYIQQMDEAQATFERELYDETANNCQLPNENKDLRAGIMELVTRLESLQPPTLSEHILAPTPTTESPTGSPALTTSIKASYSRKCSRKLDENENFKNYVLKYDKRPDHWLLYMWQAIAGWRTNPMSNIDVAAWLNKVSGALPRQAIKLRMKAVFSSHINFELAFSGFNPNLLHPAFQQSRWLTDASTLLCIESQITKGLKDHCSLSKEQIYNKIIPYMMRDDERRPLSATAIECAAHMALRSKGNAQNKGKKSVAGNSQSWTLVHALTPDKTGESSRQQLDANLESYGQAREQVLPYDEAPPSGGANSTLYEESTMDIDQIVEDIYHDC